MTPGGFRRYDQDPPDNTVEAHVVTKLALPTAEQTAQSTKGIDETSTWEEMAWVRVGFVMNALTTMHD